MVQEFHFSIQLKAELPFPALFWLQLHPELPRAQWSSTLPARSLRRAGLQGCCFTLKSIMGNEGTDRAKPKQSKTKQPVQLSNLGICYLKREELVQSSVEDSDPQFPDPLDCCTNSRDTSFRWTAALLGNLQKYFLLASDYREILRSWFSRTYLSSSLPFLFKYLDTQILYFIYYYLFIIDINIVFIKYKYINIKYIIY